MKKITLCLLLILVFAALQPVSSANAFSCSTVCTTFFALYPEDCTDTNCYARGCGAPNGYSWGSGTCYCSYCF